VSKHRMGILVATMFAVALCALGATARQAAGTSMVVTNAALQWDEIATNAVVKSGAFQNEGLVYMGYVSSAVLRAASNASGEDDEASVDAAVIEAAYRTLVNYFPSPRKAGSPDLEVLYAQSLAAIPDGEAKTKGQQIGARAASNLIASRADDGRMSLASTSAFPTLAPGPGVWRLTPPAYLAPQTPWVANVRPFILRRADRFQPAAPPSLTSTAWVNAFNEIKAEGTGTDPANKATALFWTANVIVQYNQLLRDVATSRNFDTVQTARAMAMVNVVGADAQIACMNAKYHFAFWRPVSAIDPTSVQTTDGFGATAFDDGNPLTIEQPGWRPLIATPNHPEYPAAHGSLTGAMSEVFSAILRTDQINVTVHGFDAAGAPGNFAATRAFATASDLRNEIVNARLWAGVHYRFSSEAGVQLGQKVARYDLRRFGDDENDDGGGDGGHHGND
jgi:vanadium-dependent haloperoxidase-like protein